MCVCVCVCIIINIKVYHKIFLQFKTNYSWFQTLVSIKRKKKKHNIKNIKLKSYHCILRKQIILISYHSTLIKIQKLQNLLLLLLLLLLLFCIGLYCPKLVDMDGGQYGQYLNRYEMLIFQYRFTYRYGIDYLDNQLQIITHRNVYCL